MNGETVVEIDRIVAGGRGLGHLDDGRVVLVSGALPAETVSISITKQAKRHAEATATEIVVPSPHRVEPPCPHVKRGCGGCDWQHVSPEHQRQLRVNIVQDALRRIGKLQDVPVASGPELATEGYRTTLRCALDGGAAGFRAAGSHRVVPVDSCLVAHPAAQKILASDTFATKEFEGVKEVTIRVSHKTGEHVVMANRTGDEPLMQPAVVEEVLGFEFQISGRSFFQSGPAAATVLVEAARRAMEGAPAGPLVDAYGGIGMFGVLCGAGRDVTVVETSRSAVADAEVNLAEGIRSAGLLSGTVVRSEVHKMGTQPAAVVIADPAREGLGARGVTALRNTGAPRLVLVSCDPAAMARDARLLTDAGYALSDVVVLDVFGNTSHIETVSRFDLS